MKKTKAQLKADEKFLEKFVKVGEAAKIMSKTRNTVYNRLKDGRIQTVKAFKGTPAEEEFFYRDQVENLKKIEDKKRVSK